MSLQRNTHTLAHPETTTMMTIIIIIIADQLSHIRRHLQVDVNQMSGSNTQRKERTDTHDHVYECVFACRDVLVAFSLSLFNTHHTQVIQIYPVIERCKSKRQTHSH